MQLGNTRTITRSIVSLAVLSVPLTLLALTACGGGGGGGGTSASGGPGVVGSQMGGARQGVTLALASASSTATVSTFAGQVPGADGTGPLANFNGPNAAVGDGQGNLYVADTGNNTIRKIVIATGAVTTLAGQVGVWGAADGTGTAATFWQPAGITTDGQALYVSDALNQKIRKIAPASGTLANMTSANALVTSLTGTANTLMPAGTADGAAASARFANPQNLTTDGTNLYVADAANNKIRIVAIATGATSSLTGSASTIGAWGAADGAATAARFNWPTGITTDGANLYVWDAYNHKVRVISPTGGATLTTINSASAVVGSVTGAPNTPSALGVTDGAAGSASFGWTSSIATDGASLYVSDNGNVKIRKIAPANGATLATINSASAVVSSYTGTANTVSLQGFADGAAASATFTTPVGIFADATSVYVGDSNSIRTIATATGQVSTLAGAGAAADGIGNAARMDWPANTTTDGINFYVTDCGWHSLVRKVEIATGKVTTLAGQPGLWSAVDGPGTVATFNCPIGITTDGVNLYVVDNSNNKIRKISPTGGATLATMTAATAMVTSLTGASGVAPAAGATDGPAASATFNGPGGITTDGTRLYVADSSNDKIRVITPTAGATLATISSASAVVSSLTGAANTWVAWGAADGAAPTAAFNSPQGITTDGVNLYVADSGNNKIRMIAPTAGATLATISSASAVVSSLTGAQNTALAAGAADGAAPTAAFSWPYDITTDGTHLYVIDDSNNKVRMIAPTAGATLRTLTAASAVVSSLTGTANTPVPTGFADGAAAGASFNGPLGVTTDGVSLYVMDGNNSTARKIH